MYEAEKAGVPAVWVEWPYLKMAISLPRLVSKSSWYEFFFWKFMCWPSLERLIHLSLVDIGARVRRFVCPGCGTKHREYYSLSAAGGIDEVWAIVEFWVWAVGEEFVSIPF